MIATVTAGALAFSAVLAWMMWRVCQFAGRAGRDPKYLRRKLRWLGLIYVSGSAFAMVEVATGQEPMQTLIGLPFGLRRIAEMVVPGLEPF